MKNKYLNIYNYILTGEGKNYSTNNLLDLILNDDDGDKDNIVNKQLLFFSDIKTNKENNIDIPSYLNDAQNKIIEDIRNGGKWINFSAPTSFGKSKIITELIFNSNNENLLNIIVVPTLSLENQYIIDINKIGKEASNIYLEQNKNVIYIMTPEKLNNVLSKYNNLKFNYVIFDEFYESSFNDRAFDLKKSFDSIVNNSEKIITISPLSIKYNKFNKNIEPEYISTNITATSRIINIILINDKNKEGNFKIEISKGFDFSFINESEKPANILSNNLLNYNEDNNYFKTPKNNIIFNIIKDNFLDLDRVMLFTNKAKIFKYIEHFNKIKLNKKQNKNSFFIKKIKKFLEKNSPDTLLNDLIDFGIAYHHGSMDKFLRLLIEQAYINNEINFLICSTTLSKGVNISPSYLLYDFNHKISKKNEEENKKNSIEFLNVLGRTGRMTNKEFIGKVYIFLKTKKTKEKINDLLDRGKKIDLKIEVPNYEKILTLDEGVLNAKKNEDFFYQKEINEKDIDFIKKIERRDKDFDASKLLEFIFDFFNIKPINEKITEKLSIKHFYQYISAWYWNEGYINIYNMQKEYKQNINNDSLLSDVIDIYENLLINKFCYLYDFIIKILIKRGEIKEEIETHNKYKIECFNSITTKNCFSENELNEIEQIIFKK
ncbi:MAG: DEAD/DEAH box helicase [Metamycoplasmataceae bacterium]